MDLSLFQRGHYQELLLLGLPPAACLQLLAGQFPAGLGLIKHLEISEIQGVEAMFARGGYTPDAPAPGCWLLPADAAITFLGNVHVRRCELTVLPEFPPPGPARDALLGAEEIYPSRADSAGATFYLLSPTEDRVCLAMREEALAERLLLQFVKRVAFGRAHPAPLAGEEAAAAALAPMARELALHLRRRRGDHGTEVRIAAVQHATIWFRPLLAAKFRALGLKWTYPTTMPKREVIVHPNAEKIEVLAAEPIRPEQFFGINRTWFDRTGPTWFLLQAAVFLFALYPASSLLTVGANPVGFVGLFLLLLCSFGLRDMVARD